MISKNEAKYIQSLRQKKNRDTEAVFIAEGPKLLDELLVSDLTVKKIYATSAWLNDYKGNIAAVEILEDDLQRISNLQTPNQVLAVVQQKSLATAPFTIGKLSLVLDGIQDPGNLGTIIRIADWFGIDQILASEDTADIYNSKVVQSTMGSIIRVNIWYGNLAQWLKQNTLPVFGALLNGGPVQSIKNITQGLLVIGNESKGIREDIMPFITHPVTIPRVGGAESLNAAVAAGIILSHITTA